jgi:hypothetical protein
VLMSRYGPSRQAIAMDRGVALRNRKPSLTGDRAAGYAMRPVLRGRSRPEALGDAPCRAWTRIGA